MQSGMGGPSSRNHPSGRPKYPRQNHNRCSNDENQRQMQEIPHLKTYGVQQQTKTSLNKQSTDFIPQRHGGHNRQYVSSQPNHHQKFHHHHRRNDHDIQPPPLYNDYSRQALTPVVNQGHNQSYPSTNYSQGQQGPSSDNVYSFQQKQMIANQYLQQQMNQTQEYNYNYNNYQEHLTYRQKSEQVDLDIKTKDKAFAFQNMVYKQFQYNTNQKQYEAVNQGSNELCSYFGGANKAKKQQIKIMQKAQILGEQSVLVVQNFEDNLNKIKQDLSNMKSEMMLEMPKAIQNKFLVNQNQKTSEQFIKSNYESIDELCSALTEISLCGLKLSCKNEKQIKQFTFLPYVNMVLKCSSSIKETEQQPEKIHKTLPFFLEKEQFHNRKPLFVKIKEIFANLKFQPELNPLFASYQIFVEWQSWNKSTDVKFVSIFNLDEYGNFALTSFFNPQMFANYLNSNFDQLQQQHLSSKDKPANSTTPAETSNPHSQDTTFDEELVPLSSPKSKPAGRPPRIRNFSQPLLNFIDIWDQLHQLHSKLDDYTSFDQHNFEQHNMHQSDDLDQKFKQLSDIYQIKKYQEIYNIIKKSNGSGHRK